MVAKTRNHPRVASALPHSEGIAYKPPCGEIACARGWSGWGRLSDDGSRQQNSSQSEDPWGGGLNAPQRPDCVAGHVGLELRNVDANYPFERSHRFAGIQPNSGLETIRV